MNPVHLALIGCGGFFLFGLVTGIWKFRAMIGSPDGTAPPYVDICHRAALMYGFACLVLAEFARLSPWSIAVNLVGVALPMLFFAAAVASYTVHALLNDTDNQVRRPHRLGHRHVSSQAMNLFITLLAAGEIGGFAVLFAGFLHRLSPA